jgi:hypothetical protein
MKMPCHSCLADHTKHTEGNSTNRGFAMMKLVVALICLTLGSIEARAQVVYDENDYKELADADSPDTIAVGTKITAQNWRQYKKFIPVGLQATFGGQYQIHVGSTLEYIVEVGATRDFPLPGDMAKNTEKYGGEANLEQLPNGGWLMTGYVAGVPFPNPPEPNRAVKLLYNAWVPFRPHILHNLNVGFLVDRFGNKTTNNVDAAFFGLSHLSEPGLPLNMPYANDVLYATRFLVSAPEQSKYTTQISQIFNDPRRVPENYVFLPSLRRSLRLSSAARCSPILGTDYIQDDNSWQPPNYDVKYIGFKKVLMWIGDPVKGFQQSSYVGVRANEPAGVFAGWPKHGAGLWELRKMHILDLTWNKSLGSFCYGHNIFYVDDNTYIKMMADSYDNTDKFYKLFWVKWAPVNFKGQSTLIGYAYCSPHMIDMQNSHSSISGVSNMKFDDDVPGELKDVAAMSNPGSLSHIMK